MTSIKTLPKNQIHLYRFCLNDAQENRYDNILLDESEQKRAKQFKFDLHRERFINAHLSLRQILMRYTGENPVILSHEMGKPYLKDFPSLQFNLSHSGHFGVCAITEASPVGVDIECFSTQLSHPHDYLGIAKRFFAPNEFEIIKNANNPEACFLTFWTRKEAYLKYLGKGLSHGLHLDIPSSIQLHDFNQDKSYTGAIAIEKKYQKSVLSFEI